MGRRCFTGVQHGGLPAVFGGGAIPGRGSLAGDDGHKALHYGKAGICRRRTRRTDAALCIRPAPAQGGLAAPLANA